MNTNHATVGGIVTECKPTKKPISLHRVLRNTDTPADSMFRAAGVGSNCCQCEAPWYKELTDAVAWSVANCPATSKAL